MFGLNYSLSARAIALLFAFGLVACSGSSETTSDPGGSGGGGGGGGGGSPIVVADADTESWEALQRYLSVIRTSSSFDECLTAQPALYPWKCVRGPRSGSALGKAVHDWLMSEFRQIPELTALQTQTFDVPTFSPAAYSLEVDFGGGAQEVDAFPWYYMGMTTTEGVTGELVDVGKGGVLGGLLGGDLSGKIAILEISLTFNAQDENAVDTLTRLAARGAVGAIVASDAPGDQINVQNYDYADGLRALPTVLVSHDDLQRILEAEGNQATVTVAGVYRAGDNSVPASYVGEWGKTRNTIAVLPGADPNNVLVVGTPMNAWLTAAGERGPGVGMLVYLARYFAQRSREEGPLPYTLWFVGTGGHEIYGYGINRMLSCFDEDRIVGYVHLGSGLLYTGYVEPLVAGGIPSPTGGMAQTRTLAVSENLILGGIALSAFSDLSLQPFFPLPPLLFIPGENNGPYVMGIPTVGMNGSNAYFHTLADDESQIHREALAPMAIAHRATVEGLLDADADAVRAANVVSELLAGLLKPDTRYWSCAGALQEP